MRRALKVPLEKSSGLIRYDTNHLTLNITRLLPDSHFHSSLALSFILQYGHGPVQNWVIFGPSSNSVLKQKTPECRYFSQRSTICLRCSIDSSLAGLAEKKAGDNSDLIACAKSMGITSDTNQGKSFGLQKK